MKNDDQELLGMIYESTKAPLYDFLIHEDVIDFNWERFWEVFSICKQSLFPLYESFEHIKQNKYTDLYQVTATNGAKFELSVSFHDKSFFVKQLLKTLFANPVDKEFLSTLQNAFDISNKPIMSISFRDSEGSIKTTNKLGNYAYSVVQSINDAIIASVHERTSSFPDILWFQVLKTESRKQTLFIKGIEHNYTHFKHVYVDENSEQQFNTIYIYV